MVAASCVHLRMISGSSSKKEVFAAWSTTRTGTSPCGTTAYCRTSKRDSVPNDGPELIEPTPNALAPVAPTPPLPGSSAPLHPDRCRFGGWVGWQGGLDSPDQAVLNHAAVMIRKA